MSLPCPNDCINDGLERVGGGSCQCPTCGFFLDFEAVEAYCVQVENRKEMDELRARAEKAEAKLANQKDWARKYGEAIDLLNDARARVVELEIALQQVADLAYQHRPPNHAIIDIAEKALGPDEVNCGAARMG